MSFGAIVRDVFSFTYNTKRLDQLKGIVVVLVVQLWLPVVALVQSLVARGVLGIASIVIAHEHVVARASDNVVNMAAELAGAYNRVSTLHRQRAAVNDEETALGRSQGGSRRKNKKGLGNHFPAVVRSWQSYVGV